MDEFKKSYFEWRKNNGHITVAWLEEHYKHVFQTKQIVVVRKQTYLYMGERRTCDYLIGICPSGVNDEDGDGAVGAA